HPNEPHTTAPRNPNTRNTSTATTPATYKPNAVFDNGKSLLFPNQFVNIHLLVDVKKNLVVVPAAAIQRGPQGTYVYAVDSTNTVKIRPVALAQTTGNSVGLSSGLQGGELVVIDGQDKLQDGSKVNPTVSSPSQAAQSASAAGQGPAAATPPGRQGKSPQS